MSYSIDEEEELEPLEEEEASEEKDPYDLSSSYTPFKASIFPVLIINKNLKIIYTNEACQQMFPGFKHLMGNIFSIYSEKRLNWKT